MKTAIKTAAHAIATHLSGFGLLILAACPWFAPPARAGLTLDLQLDRFFGAGNYYYDCWPNLNTNGTPPNVAYGSYVIESPGYPDNGFRSTYQFDANGFNETTGDGNMETDFNLFSQDLTNGNWSIYVSTNGATTNVYHFTVTANLGSNSIPPVMVTYPTNGPTFVPNQPNFTWQGPADWAGTLEVQDNFTATNGSTSSETGAYLATTATNWPCPVALPNGTNTFYAQYETNIPSLVVASTPVDNLSRPISSWTPTANLITFCDFQFIVGTPVPNPNTNILIGGHTLVAHYTFDNSGFLGQDSSGNGNDLTGETWWGPVHQFSADAEAGGGAVWFFGTSDITANGQALANLNAVLAGSFTFSAWVNTTVTKGADDNNAILGAVIFWAYNDRNNANDAIPLAITGSKAAFTTRDHFGISTTLHSNTSVNDGNYHLITVTRDQVSGQMKIYVDGNLEAYENGTTDPLNGNNYNLTIGGYAYGIDNTGTNYASYNGLLDDLQIYSGVLNSDEVAGLANNPGITATNFAGTPANGLVAHYDFDEGTVVAPDVSGNGNDIVLAGNFGGNGPAISTDAIAGAGSVYFDGGSFLTAPARLLPTLAGSFTISLWVKTTQYCDYPGDYAYNGAVVIAADVPNVANDLVPVALTGGQVAFNTGNTEYGYDDTINSSATVNDGNWHHVAVDRNQTTGEKDIYIDGVLDAFDFDTTAFLDDPQLLTIGASANAALSDPMSPSETGYNGYQGLVDDIQIYNHVLSPDEVSFLNDHPGATITSSSASGPNPAQLINAQCVGANFQFSFLSQTGVTNSVQYRTNLIFGHWLTYSNVTGNGGLQTITIPFSVFNNSDLGFIRISSQ
jgi:hypothetical protein